MIAIIIITPYKSPAGQRVSMREDTEPISAKIADRHFYNSSLHSQADLSLLRLLFLRFSLFFSSSRSSERECGICRCKSHEK